MHRTLSLSPSLATRAVASLRPSLAPLNVDTTQDINSFVPTLCPSFSTDYQYNLVRSVFTFTPEYQLIDAPYQIQNPKKMYAALKVKPKKEIKSPKKEIKPIKGKRKEDTADYIALLEVGF